MECDHSPKRSVGAEFLRPWCNTYNQQRLLFCGIALSCDVPILEAIFFNIMAFYALKSHSVFTLRNVLASHMTLLHPSWVRHSGWTFTNDEQQCSITFRSPKSPLFSDAVEIVCNERLFATLGSDTDGRLKIWFPFDPSIYPRPGTFESDIANTLRNAVAKACSNEKYAQYDESDEEWVIAHFKNRQGYVESDSE